MRKTHVLTLVLLTLSCHFSSRPTAVADEVVAGTIKETAWRYRLQQPAENWFASEFDDRGWKQGFGGFGEASTPGSRVSTAWHTNNIWLRKTVDLPSVPGKLALLVHHDEDAEVYLNGKQVAALKGFLTEYRVVPLDAEAHAAVKPGKNLLAVHCWQRNGGQFIDVHLIDADNVPKLPKPKRSTTPFKSELITRWGEKVTPENAWQEYPRPALFRQHWQNLNGTWQYAITAIGHTSKPAEWDGDILVPFCLESKLSGVQRLLDADEALWYRRVFEAAKQSGQRTMLNFEAVDYRTEVWVNDKLVGKHTGGNDPFTFDITNALKEGTNELVVRVEDETEGSQLRGKQVLNAHGIWYTQVSGIWQTVWLEQLPSRYIEDLKITTDASAGTITVRPILSGEALGSEQIVVDFNQPGVVKTVEPQAGGRIVFTLKNPALWSPDSPVLYAFDVKLVDRDGAVVDEVASYAGIRTVGKVRDKQGHLRFTINGKPIFHFGPLDQGWWPDGLLTPPSEDAMNYDIDFLKNSGFNMIRKHIKVEPRRYYYNCDRIGMMIWQDQVSGGKNPNWTRLQPNPADADWSDEDHNQYMLELEEMIGSLENHPCIVVWVPFNEAWGQHRTLEVGEWTVRRDPTRLVNIASGGNFWPVGDIVDHHSYPHPAFPFDENRYRDFIKVMGEFGGHGLPTQGHLWDVNKRNWGYGGLPKNANEYLARYQESIRLLTELKANGIAAGVYTQTTDVEGEINGLMTYDREVIKVPAEKLRKIHEPLISVE